MNDVGIGPASLTEADVAVEAVGNMDAKTLEKYASDVIARLYAGDGKNIKAIRTEI